ncbi:ABC transporter ATP-binding protein [bacterium]|nr:ABC transporter ATP-binding protein [bacterium]
MDDPIIDLQDVWFGYNGQMILQGIDLKVERGDFIAMIGPNGGGKTTLLKVILGLYKPLRGTVVVKGRSADKASSFIGYVPQNVHINSSFPITVLDVVLMGKLSPGRFFKHDTKMDRQQAMEALGRMQIEDLAGERIGELSGGQKQRVFIARSLVTDPEILLLDEPTASIDSKGQSDFLKLLVELNKTITILVVSHDLFAISSFVKSVACVNRRLHYHMPATNREDTMNAAYRCTVEDTCPVEKLHLTSTKHEVAE